MPVITALEVHRRNKDSVRLVLDQEFALDVPLLQAAQLHKGQCLTQVEVNALATLGSVQSAYNRALRFLSYRPRSTAELRRHLLKNAVPGPVVSEVLDRLHEREYLGDSAFASFWLENRSRFKPMAPRALRYELMQKGVAAETIDAALSALDVDDAAYRAATGWSHRFRGNTRQVFRRKLSALLRRRGFDGETVNDVIRRLQQELDDSKDGFFSGDVNE